mmetsp:Transcript_75978/g.180724  ORF Transcript_75978/g.180724 Transcript_75978/m.180724 type:complete len:207 (-) Transcript_75978:497-1117(-)
MAPMNFDSVRTKVEEPARCSKLDGVPSPGTDLSACAGDAVAPCRNQSSVSTMRCKWRFGAERLRQMPLAPSSANPYLRSVSRHTSCSSDTKAAGAGKVVSMAKQLSDSWLQGCVFSSFKRAPRPEPWHHSGPAALSNASATENESSAPRGILDERALARSALKSLCMSAIFCPPYCELCAVTFPSIPVTFIAGFSVRKASSSGARA